MSRLPRLKNGLPMRRITEAQVDALCESEEGRKELAERIMRLVPFACEYLGEDDSKTLQEQFRLAYEMGKAGKHIKNVGAMFGSIGVAGCAIRALCEMDGPMSVVRALQYGGPGKKLSPGGRLVSVQEAHDWIDKLDDSLPDDWTVDPDEFKLSRV